MVGRQLLLRAFIRAAKKYGDANSKTPIAVLEAILLGRFTAEATEGKTLVTSTENGGTVTFMLPHDFGPADVMALAEEAIEWLEQQPDPNNPKLAARRIKRLRVSFANAAI
jgi:hypothetical protein